MHAFERALAVAAEEIQLWLRGCRPEGWAEFLLNPRRLRGSDFLMRWSQGVWSEQRVIQAVNATGRYFALPYGPSGTAPQDDVRAFELYFERLEKAGLGQLKRPDILIFRAVDRPLVAEILKKLKGQAELPFTAEDNAGMKQLLGKAVLAVECENSLWRAKQMPDYGVEMTPQKRLDGRLGMKKTAVLPTVIIKEEDRKPLRAWQTQRRVPIHIWHIFYDLAFGLAFDRAEALIQNGQILPTEQVFQAPGGATTRKVIYKFYYHYAYPLGETKAEPTLVATHITDRNGHILPYVKFDGGELTVRPEAVSILEENAQARK